MPAGLAMFDPARAADGRPQPEISVLEVAPALLRRFAVKPAGYMTRPALLEPAPPDPEPPQQTHHHCSVR